MYFLFILEHVSSPMLAGVEREVSEGSLNKEASLREVFEGSLNEETSSREAPEGSLSMAASLRQHP